MCLLFVSYRLTPGYPLALAANRDEFYRRPTAPLGFLDEGGSILGGRDLQGGGTWLGIGPGLRFAALTNYRDPASNRADAPSRGAIVLDYLLGSASAEDYLRHLSPRAGAYNGFNLVAGDGQGLFSLSSRQPGYCRLEPGFYGLSNHLLDSPWPKVIRGKELLRPHLVDRPNVEGVFAALGDRFQPEASLLPDTGVGPDWERLLSSIFIGGETYGTRSSALILVDHLGGIDFYEKTHPIPPQQEAVMRHMSLPAQALLT